MNGQIFSDMKFLELPTEEFKLWTQVSLNARAVTIQLKFKQLHSTGFLFKNFKFSKQNFAAMNENIPRIEV